MNDEPAPAPKKRSFITKALAIIAVVALVLGGIWWWINRPIEPVTLSASEMAAVEAKMEAIHKPAEPKYEKGSKEIIITERELNGLLNDKTTLGKTLSFELATNAIHARVEADLDPDLPLVGGRHLKARARFLVSKEPSKPALVLDDVTIWGISLPNDWLGGLKGHDLLGEILGGTEGRIAGIEGFIIEPGRLIIRLAD